MNQPFLELPKVLLQTLNQLYDIERKLAMHGDNAGVSRNVERIKDAFLNEQLFYEDPMGQPFNETRTDLDVSIAGEGAENLVVTEVIKPIIRNGTLAFSRVVQKGIVVVQSKGPCDEQAQQQGDQK
jgi:hypothetical protein